MRELEMRMTCRAVSLLMGAALGVAAVAPPSTAQACSAPQQPDTFFPYAGEVPADLAAIVYTSATAEESLTEADLRFVRKTGTGYAPVPFTLVHQARGTYHVVPDSPLEADTSYVLWGAVNDELPEAPPLERLENLPPSTTAYATSRERPQSFAKFDTVAAGAAPTSLGAVDVSPVNTTDPVILAGGAGCIWEPDAGAQLTVSLNIESEYADLLQYAVYVDDELVTTAPAATANIFEGFLGEDTHWRARDAYRLVAYCANGKAHGPVGEHEVQFTATLPGSDTVIESERATFTLPELDCGEAQEHATEDASMPDTGGVQGTGGQPGDPTTTGGAVDTDEDSAFAEASGCSAGGSGPLVSFAWVTAVLGLPLLRLRRRR